MDIELRKVCSGQFVSILVDGASSRLVQGAKITAVMVYNTKWNAPLLLDVIFDHEASTAVQLAEKIREILPKYEINLHTHVTSLVGDNASIVDKLARELGLPRLKCIAHALNLVMKAITKYFPSYACVLRGVHRAITAGGGTKRRTALQEKKVLINRILVHENRWLSLVNAGNYYMSETDDFVTFGIFRVIKAFFVRIAAANIMPALAEEEDVPIVFLPPGAPPGAHEEPAELDADMNAYLAQIQVAPIPAHDIPAVLERPIAAVHFQDGDAYDAAEMEADALAPMPAQNPEAGHAAQRGRGGNTRESPNRVDITGAALIAALQDPFTPVDFIVVDLLTELLVKLIPEAGSNNLDPALAENLREARAYLVLCQTRPVSIIDSAVVRSINEYTDRERATLDERLIPMIQAAMASAIYMFDKHVVPALHQLRVAFRLHPANKPADIPSTTRGNEDVINFLGCSTRLATAQLYREYDSYQATWETVVPKNFNFWYENSARKKFPNLSLLGRWYAQLPSSSVGVERFFGQMRAMEAPNRGAMKRVTFVSLLKHRNNHWLLRQVFDDAYDRMNHLL